MFASRLIRSTADQHSHLFAGSLQKRITVEELVEGTSHRLISHLGGREGYKNFLRDLNGFFELSSEQQQLVQKSLTTLLSMPYEMMQHFKFEPNPFNQKGALDVGKIVMTASEGSERRRIVIDLADETATLQIGDRVSFQKISWNELAVLFLGDFRNSFYSAISSHHKEGDLHKVLADRYHHLIEDQIGPKLSLYLLSSGEFSNEQNGGLRLPPEHLIELLRMELVEVMLDEAYDNIGKDCKRIKSLRAWSNAVEDVLDERLNQQESESNWSLRWLGEGLFSCFERDRGPALCLNSWDYHSLEPESAQLEIYPSNHLVKFRDLLIEERWNLLETEGDRKEMVRINDRLYVRANGRGHEAKNRFGKHLITKLYREDLVDLVKSGHLEYEEDLHFCSSWIEMQNAIADKEIWLEEAEAMGGGDQAVINSLSYDLDSLYRARNRARQFAYNDGGFYRVATNSKEVLAYLKKSRGTGIRV